ncbi:MAG: 50S ribosomal subunit-associated GTPase HflX, partial [Myxococcota bacterium]
MRVSRRRGIVAGLFSAKQPQPEALLSQLADALEARGAVIVGRVFQRRGVSRGGAAKMNQPLSWRTVFGPGKTREIVALCQETDADCLVTCNILIDKQRKTLSELTGVEVQDGYHLGIDSAAGGVRGGLGGSARG